MEGDENRKIVMPPVSSSKRNSVCCDDGPRDKQKRVVTVLQKWMFSNLQLSFEKQKEYLKQIQENLVPEENQRICKVILQQIQQKLYGYRAQDISKRLYLEEKMIDVERTIDKLVECDLKCFYCNCEIQVIYEYVREPRQWTLERIENTAGHNTDNVVIACLHCNLHRRTMYHERYLFTKQMDIKKTG